MRSLTEALAGQFVVANLGAGGDGDYAWPADLLRTVTMIEIDGATEPVGSQGRYFAKHRLRQVIAGSAQPRQFKQRAYWGSSSLLDNRPEILAKYNLFLLNTVQRISEVAPVTLPSLLSALQIEHLDFLKTDLEGLDFEILQSLGPYLDQVLAIQCEVRTEPLFQGEPYFFEIAQFLQEQGFELVGWRPEVWRPASRHQAQHLDGVLVWADALFLKTPVAVERWPAADRPLTQAKHILLAALLGKKSYAEWLLDRYQADLPPAWLDSLRAQLQPERSFGHGLRLLRKGVLDALFVTPVWPWLRRLRRKLRPQALTMDHVLRAGIDQ